MKRVISVLLTVTMLLSMFAVNITASAEEVTIFNEIELNYTRDVMESKTAFQKFVVKGEDEVYSLSADAWDLPSSAAVCDNYPSVFNEDIFMDAKTGFGINAENNYKTTINDIPYQFGVIKSEVNGVADEPGNVIHSADFDGAINIPVEKAPYDNLYMIAWSGATHGVSAVVTYNYTDGTTSTDENITSISGGTTSRDETDYVKKLPSASRDYVETWRIQLKDAAKGTIGARNVRMFQHKLTPDSTKILESVTITTEGKEINIFALTGVASSISVTNILDNIKKSFESEEKLTTIQLDLIEKDVPVLVELLTTNNIDAGTYATDIATLVANRRQEIEEESSIITEFDINNKIALNYTRDVMEDRDQYISDKGTWSISEKATSDGYAFDEGYFMRSDGYGVGATDSNNYAVTLNNIPYQFGILDSEVNGVADEPGNVIHSADSDDKIIIPVDKAPYANLYMIAWSGLTDNVVAEIIYNYTDGSTSTDANINAISGGSRDKTDTEFITQLNFGKAKYLRIWKENDTATSTKNIRIFQHKLTPDATKILESVTITTQGQEINIFALTATTQSMVVKARLDDIVARFDTEELTEDQLKQIEKDTKILVDILKEYGINPKYEAQIATLVAERREELAVNARKENFGVRENTAVELNLFEDAFMGLDEFYGKGEFTTDLSATVVAEDSIYRYKGMTLEGKILGEIAYPQATNRKGGTVAMIIEADNYAARANATIKSQLEAGKLVLSNDGRYDFTVAGTKYHLGEISTGRKTGNIFFPGQKYTVPTGEILPSVYTQDKETDKVLSATYPINKAGLSSVNILSSSFANILVNNTNSSYKAGETRGELVPVTITYSDGESEEYYIVNGSIYLDLQYAIRVANKDEALKIAGYQLQYADGSAVPVGTQENINIDLYGRVFELNGKKLLMPKGSEILASINRLSQNFGTYNSGLGYTYSYEIPVTKLNTTVESVTVGNPVSLAVADMKKLLGSDNVVQDGLAAYIKVDSDAENDYYVGIYSFNEDRNFSGIFAMTTVACSIQEMIDEIEAEVVKAEPDMKKLNDLLTCLETFENFRYEEDLSANAKAALGFVKSNIEITEDSVNKIWATANIMSGEDGIAVVAFYNKDGNLIKIKTAPVSNGSTVEVGTKPEGTVLIKGFLWKSFETLKPLARDTSIDTREYALDNIYYNGQWVTDCQEELNIAFLGDSICYGTAWSTMICDYFEEKTGRNVNMYNASIPGAKSERAAEMLDDAILPLNPDIVIVENYNDISASFDKGCNDFESIIRRLTKQEKQPVIIVYHPNAPYVDGTIGSRYTYEKQYELHTAKDAIAMQYNVKSISFAKYFEQLIADEKAKGTDMAEWLTTYYNSDNTHCTKAGYTLMGDYFIDSLDKNPSAYLVRHNVATIPVNVAADRKYVRTFADNSRFKYTGFAVYTPASDVSGLTGAAAIPAKITKFPHGAIAQTNAEKSVLEFETTAKEISVWYSTAAEKNSTRDVEIYVDGELLNTVTTEKNNVSFIRYIDISLNGGKHKVEIKPIFEEGKVFNFNCLTERY